MIIDATTTTTTRWMPCGNVGGRRLGSWSLPKEGKGPYHDDEDEDEDESDLQLRRFFYQCIYTPDTGIRCSVRGSRIHRRELR